MKLLKIISLVTLFILSSCSVSPEERKEIKLSALNWLQENKLNGTVSCNKIPENYCDVTFIDPRSPVLLYCNKSFCTIEK